VCRYCLVGTISARHRWGGVDGPSRLLARISSHVAARKHRATSVNDADLSVADLVREVKVALLKVAEAVEAQDLPKLDKAELEVNTSIKTDGDGKVSLWVVELGASGKSEYASTLTLTLRPPPPGSPSNITAVHLADALSEAILAGARAIQAARKGDPPLLADELIASVHFGIERNGKGNFGVKFRPFEASAGASIGTAQVQTITVTYKR
jgi:Trypsin-co-occurring domain 2